MKALLLALLLSGMLVPHDFFISILTIRHNAEKATLDMTWQMTAHDIEHALANVAELKLGSTKEHPKADSLLNAYFIEHLHLEQADKGLHWKWIGQELEGENLFCYLQVEGIGSANNLSVSNSLLQDVFREQDNIVHVEAMGRTLTEHFVSGSVAHTFTW